jgi:hypothetical protein
MSEKKSSRLDMLEINKLLTYKFYIPAYQRGYRWTDVQVNALLNDIWEFNKNNIDPEKFYCLQPIVIKEKIVNEIKLWEIIDGQQRLTTILIMLYYFNQTEFKTPKGIFNIEFATRPSSNSFLMNIENANMAKGNVDYFHIHEAYNTVKHWFENKVKTEGTTTVASKFYETLVDKVNVIWYEINNEDEHREVENAIDVFTRINMGKIPLTNSELTKALFLQKKNFKEHQTYMQVKIAKEWDDIERKLQDDSFWYFIYHSKNTSKYENRIEYIFDLLKDKKKDFEEHFTFNRFIEDIKVKNIDDIWLEIKNYFQCLEEWYNDSELYHLIGFLIENKADINTLQQSRIGRTKKGFVEYLNEEIVQLFKNISLDELEYPKDSSDIRMTLLLFNIKTIIATQKAEVRFPFDKFKKENWDIEHVNSSTETVIPKNSRAKWALDILEYFTGKQGYSDKFIEKENLTEKEIQQNCIQNLNIEEDIEFCRSLIKILEEEKIAEEDFKILQQQIQAHFKEGDIKQNDGISNLALLDEGTNRSYKNAMFPIKRKYIVINDQNGIFVPICTKNLFLKYYSKQMSGIMYWNTSDATDYFNAIKNTLSIYLQNQNQ